LQISGGFKLQGTKGQNICSSGGRTLATFKYMYYKNMYYGWTQIAQQQKGILMDAEMMSLLLNWHNRSKTE
jgi:hypothetical protein